MEGEAFPVPAENETPVQLLSLGHVLKGILYIDLSTTLDCEIFTARALAIYLVHV